MSKLADGSDARDLEIKGAYSEFDGKIIETVAASLSTLVGTIITVLQFRKNNRSSNLDLLTEKWELELIQHGLPAEKAKAITARYGEDLKKHVL